jgi:hypothetical protein
MRWTDEQIEDSVLSQPRPPETDEADAFVEPRGIISTQFNRQTPPTVTHDADSDAWNNWAQIHRDREWEDRVKPALDAFEAAIVEVIVELRREWRNDLAKQWNERVGPEFNSLVREMREELRKEITDALSHEKSAEVIDLPDWRRGRGNAAA